MAVVGYILILLNVGCISGQLYIEPEQVHIAYGSNPHEMVVSWVTMSKTKYSMVEYGINNLTTVTEGTISGFIDGGSQKRKLYMDYVKLTNLKADQKYLYHCGSPEAWSELFSFKTMSKGTNWSPRFAVYGDLGNENPQSLGRLQEETQLGHFDAILHVGDFAYDMDSDNARVGDAFMRQIEAIAAYVPYMTAAGNHENAYNFSNYVNRFNMPGKNGNSLFYSFDIGPAHIIIFSTEFYFFNGSGSPIVQYEWLENDLKSANLPQNRAQRPWIITMAHRPMYCSDLGRDDCTKFESIVRHGEPKRGWDSLEDLFYKYGVDLELWAHEHDYERLWPIYNRMVCNGTTEPYTNPRAPVHVITGSAGCKERHDPFWLKPSWSAFRSEDYGYSRMTIYNSTHLYIEQVSDDKKGNVIDKMMLIKDKHKMGQPQFDCHRGVKSSFGIYKDISKMEKMVSLIKN